MARQVRVGSTEPGLAGAPVAPCGPAHNQDDSMSAACMRPAAWSTLPLVTCLCICPVCSLRALYGTDGTMNATHGSDSRASASREIRFHFPKLTQVCPGKGGCLHKSAMLHATQPETYVAMVTLVAGMKLGALSSHDTHMWRQLVVQQRFTGLPLQQCSSEHGTAAQGVSAAQNS